MRLQCALICDVCKNPFLGHCYESVSNQIIASWVTCSDCGSFYGSEVILEYYKMTRGGR
jgi:hypothetical protein